MKNTEGYEYYAFISYKRENVQWAKWLHHKLEHYRLPANIRKNNKDLPNKIRPVFQDSQELSGGLLSKSIENSLKQSKYLIVICSPLSAKSPWVNREVQTFIDFGREENIIPFIIDGTPFSSKEEKECFPPALLNLKGARELLGISINEMGRDAAIVKVVARMFDLKFDTLWQRYEREKKRKRFIITAIVLAFALISLGIGSYILRLNGNLEKSNKSLKRATIEAQKQRDRANEESKEKQLAYDSILKQQGIIQKANEDLLLTNNQLREERDKVKKANWKMMENQSRVVAEQANKLIDEGDSYTARLLLLSVLPKDLSNPDRPYTPEAEAALRRAIESETGKIKYPEEYDFVVNFSDPIFTPDGNYIVAKTIKTISVFNTESGHFIKNIPMSMSSIYEKILGFSSTGDTIYTIQNSRGLITVYNMKSCKLIDSIKVDTHNFKYIDVNNFRKTNELFVLTRDEKVLLGDLTKKVYETFTIPHTIYSYCAKKQNNDIVIIGSDSIITYDYSKKIKVSSWSIPEKSTVYLSNKKIIAKNNDSIVVWDILGNKLHSKILINNSALYEKEDGNFYFFDSDTIKEFDINTYCIRNIRKSSFLISKRFPPISISSNDVMAIVNNGSINLIDLKNTTKNNIDNILFKYFERNKDYFFVANYFANLSFRNNNTSILPLFTSSFTSNTNYYPYFDKNECIFTNIQNHNTFRIVEEPIWNIYCDSLNIITIDTFGVLNIYDITNKNLDYKSYNLKNRLVKDIISTKDGKIIVIGNKNDSVVTIYNKENMRTIKKLKLDKNIQSCSYQHSLLFSSDEKYLIILLKDNRLLFYDTEHYQLIKSYYLSKGFINSVNCFDNKLVITYYGHIEIRDINSGFLLNKYFSFISSEAILHNAILDTNGRQIFYLLKDTKNKGYFLVGKIPFPSLQDIITEQRKRFEGRGLTDEEKRRYYLE